MATATFSFEIKSLSQMRCQWKGAKRIYEFEITKMTPPLRKNGTTTIRTNDISNNSQKPDISYGQLVQK